LLLLFGNEFDFPITLINTSKIGVFMNFKWWKNHGFWLEQDLVSLFALFHKYRVTNLNEFIYNVLETLWFVLWVIMSYELKHCDLLMFHCFVYNLICILWFITLSITCFINSLTKFMSVDKLK
jgi:hypothetical protein